MFHKRITKLEEENKKLKELIYDLADILAIHIENREIRIECSKIVYELWKLKYEE